MIFVVQSNQALSQIHPLPMLTIGCGLQHSLALSQTQSLSLSRACASRAYKGRLGGMQKLNFNETFESPFTVFSNSDYEGVMTLLLRR